MKKFIKWLTAKRLMERWNVNEQELAQAIQQGLAPYRIRKGGNRFKPPLIYSFYELMGEESYDAALVKNITDNKYSFKISDVEQFEAKYDMIPVANDGVELSGKERTELGRLKVEKEKWDDSIKAGVIAGLYCGMENRQVTKNELLDELAKNGIYYNETTPAFKKIRKALPRKFKKDAGRVRKNCKK